MKKLTFWNRAHSPYLSTTPTLPPPDNFMFHHSPSVSVATASPFLAPEGFGMLPVPESPLAGSTNLSHHRHNLSTASAPPAFYHPADRKNSAP